MEIKTKYGSWIPKFSFEETRTKDRKSVDYYLDGQLKSVYMEAPSPVITEIGKIEAEFVTFYESGEIHRVFPRYGQISGFWSVEEEGALLKEITIPLAWGDITVKVACLCFYPGGQLKSITLWENECVSIPTLFGSIDARIGISFYEKGAIKSLEPIRPSVIKTPLGVFLAYDNGPIGVHGDKNSLQFYENGAIRGLKTVQSGVEIILENNELVIIEPEKRPSMLELDEMVVVPIEVGFNGDNIYIIDSDGKRMDFSRSTCRFRSFVSKEAIDSVPCGECSSCQHCK
ncbi:hypothetical protein [Anaeromicropila populeti]|uniref:Uncharacterized protein n=1 Tax=Anaeromicropila populeti TaxID=37658 RepID=A0A1I6HUT8_9FIRM|nr:hypothetical protein [Anaeromicropila populeti]SFR58222.1 hypothetical protein SAMN05661086_00317 [Anaeromicropila populeti]